jgi:two-component system, NarL family, response regulator NreC
MIRFVIADDHYVVRQGLRAFLEADPEFSVVGEVDSGSEAISLVETLQPDVLIVDLIMPGMGGLEVAEQVTRQWPNVRVIILSGHADDATVRQALAVGAAGYVLKNADPAELSRAIQDVIAGRHYLSPPLSERAIEAFMRGTAQAAFDEYDTLTGREQEVLKLAAMGLNNAEVAAKLSISPRTAETHRGRIMHKLGLRTQTELVRYAIRRGILPMDE